MAAERWSLYVDESGNFGDGPDAPSPVSVVSGLLVRDHETQTARERLRAELEAIWSPVPWPPHAAFLWWPATLVVCNAMARPRHAPAPDANEAERLSRCGEQLARVLPEETCESLLDDIAMGRTPKPSSLVDLDARLRSVVSRGEYAALSAGLEERHRKTRDLLARIRTQCEGDAYVVGAAMGAPYPPLESVGQGAVVRTPWVRAVEALLERVYAVLRDRARVAPRLTLRVLTRHVTLGPEGAELARKHARYGTASRVRTDVDQAVIEEIAGRAASVPRLRDGVRVEPKGHPNRFDDDVHPLLVLADYVALQARRRIPLDNTLATVTAGIDDALAGGGRWTEVPPRSDPATRLPGLAAEGPARRAVTRALAGLGAPDFEIAPGWPREQAALWVDAIAKGVAS